MKHFVDDSTIEVDTNERNILLKLKSESNLGFLIGKKGEMIKNIEFLLSRIASKQNSESIFVSIDINSFREKKDKELVERVGVLIDKVISINRPLSLNPMNSYERRICYLEIEKNIDSGTQGFSLEEFREFRAAQQAEEKTETQAALKLAAERGGRYKENPGTK